MKPIIIHRHIFKNAGGTIDWALEKNFKNDVALMTYEHPFQRGLPIEVVLKYFKLHPELKAFSSHNIIFPQSIELDVNLISILFIRHPIDRGFSIYSYNRRIQGNDDIQFKKAKSLSLKDFIDWNINKSQERVMNNYQLWELSNHSLEPLKEIYSITEKIIKNCEIVGVVDRFDESMVLAEELLKPYYEKIDLSYIRKHVSTDRLDSLEKRFDDGRLELDATLMDDFIQKNSWDLKLYEVAKNELDRRINKISNFSNKLKNFEERCKKLLANNIGKIKQGRSLYYSYEKNELVEKI